MSAQRVVVTGGHGDLAAAVAHEFRHQGDKVLTPGRDQLDVRDTQSVDAFFTGQCCNLLIACAGVAQDSLLARLPEKSWDQVWDVNFAGARRCANAALPRMREIHQGHIVFLSSYSAIHPPAGQANYATAKAALLGLTNDLAARHGPSNIRVNAVLPGFLENRMSESVSAARREAVKSEHALRRFNTTDRVASFIRFLHHELPHTSGQVFSLDSRRGLF